MAASSSMGSCAGSALKFIMERGLGLPAEGALRYRELAMSILYEIARQDDRPFKIITGRTDLLVEKIEEAELPKLVSKEKWYSAHHLLILKADHEMDSHVLCFHPRARLIFDNGTLIQVPVRKDFNGALSFYLDCAYGGRFPYTRYSLIKVYK
jgi:hypothetical protein